MHSGKVPACSPRAAIDQKRIVCTAPRVFRANAWHAIRPRWQEIGSASGDTYSDDSPYESTGSYFSNRLGGPHPNNNTEFVDEYGSESDSSSSGSNHNPDDQEEHYEDAVYDDWGDSKGQGNGSFSTGSSTSTTGRLPPVT